MISNVDKNNKPKRLLNKYTAVKNSRECLSIVLVMQPMHGRGTFFILTEIFPSLLLNIELSFYFDLNHYILCRISVVKTLEICLVM